jgi:anaerobic selenocysteine-containing dehydrogenase
MTMTSEVRTHFRSCPFCEAACGLEVTADHRTRRIVRVRADKLDPYSKGFTCPKAYALPELHSDPDRLQRPLRRKGNDFEEIGWQEALDYAAERLKAIRDQHGPHSIGYYFGNPTGHKGPLLIYGTVLIEALGTMQVYSPGTLDQIPKHVSGALMFGGALVQPLADVDRTDYLVIAGSNPVVSQGSMMVAPGIASRLKAIRARGGKLVVIDPRRTETAEIADEYIAIRPGTDAYLMFAILNVLVTEKLVRLGRAEGLVKGLETVQALAMKFPPERVVAVTGVPAEQIRRLAHELAAAPSAAIHGRTGTCTQQFGTVANWLIDCVNTLTGNLDRPGGSMFAGGGVPTPILFNETFRGDVPPVGRWHSRVRKLPEAIGMLPTAALADEILTPGEGQVRGFITQAGNIVLSNPNGARLAQAFDSLEFMLSFDIYVNETTRHADLIIPGPSYVEHADFAAVTPYEMLRKYVKWAGPIFPAPDGMPHDWEIFAGLAARMRGTSLAALEESFLDRLLQKAIAEGRPECRTVSPEAARAALGDEPGADRIFDLMIRSGPYGDAFGAVPDGLNLERVKQHLHGLDLGPLTEALPGVLATPDKLIDLAPPRLVADVPRLEAALDKSAGPASLLLIGRRHVQSKNAWMHNLDRLMGGRERCTLLMHPEDAAQRGLRTGDRSRLSSHNGSIEVPVEVTDEMMVGVVSLPHGWGHGMAGTRQRVANAHPGANVNAIINELALDVPSATTILNGVAVEVEPITS